MTGAIITAVGTILGGVATILLTYFVRRTDRVAKATRANMEDQQYVMRLVSVLRDDYWTLADWAYFARGRFSEVLDYAMAKGGVFDRLPVVPSPRHRILEARHAAGDTLDDDDDA